MSNHLIGERNQRANSETTAVLQAPKSERRLLDDSPLEVQDIAEQDKPTMERKLDVPDTANRKDCGTYAN